MDLNHKQLTFAREFRGYNQTELAQNIPGLSQSNLSKFEKGIGYLSDDILLKIFDFLNFPSQFFHDKVSNVVENPHYRKRSTINKKEVNQIESSIKIIGYIVDQMSESLEWPDFDLTPLDIEEGYSVKNIANFTRKSLGLKPDEPIKDIYKLIENHGIVIAEIDISDKFDGASLITDTGIPVIISNKRFSNDRKRFTLAHELGHLLMHILGGFPIPDYREREKEANLFASEFLMPEKAIKKSLYGVTLRTLGELKRYWLTSMASILHKSYELGCISKDRYTNINIEMSRLGLKRDEKIKVYIDKPSIFHEAYKMHKTDLDYSDQELSEAFHLPIDIINSFCKSSNKGKLRIVA